MIENQWSQLTACYRYPKGNKYGQSLDRLKEVLKHLHNVEYGKCGREANYLYSCLRGYSIMISNSFTYVSLQTPEKIWISELKQWMHVKESACRQKANLYLLQLGDSSNHFSCSAMRKKYLEVDNFIKR